MLPSESVISAVTLAELSVGPHVAKTEAERIARQAHLQQAENDFDVIAFDGGAARAFGAVAGALRTAGRKKAARAYDVLIAVTAVSEGFRCTPATQTTSRAFPGWTCASARIPMPRRSDRMSVHCRDIRRCGISIDLAMRNETIIGSCRWVSVQKPSRPRRQPGLAKHHASSADSAGRGRLRPAVARFASAAIRSRSEQCVMAVPARSRQDRSDG
jgi:tRNA(fMet)-specific endonuclease VapC